MRSKILKFTLTLAILLLSFSLPFLTSARTFERKVEKTLLGKLKTQQEIDVIVLFKDKPKRETVRGEVRRTFHIIPAISAKITPSEIRRLVTLKGVVKIYENKEVQAILDDSVPMIRADKAWEEGIDGTGVKVCIPDTGIDDHKYLPTPIAWIDFVNNLPQPYDDNGHGTYVTGIVVSQHPTYRGVSPGVSLMIAKVLDASGIGHYDDVIAAIEWCVENGADVISLSLGGEVFRGNCDYDIVAQAVNEAVESGVTVVVAAGNMGRKGITTPACASKAIAVGAVDKQGYVAYWSGKGRELDIVAPGVSIVSLFPEDRLAVGSGTSAAAPHVSGTIALLLGANPKLSVKEIKEALYRTASQARCRVCWSYICFVRRCRKDEQGAGIVDAYAAYRHVSIAPTTTTTLPLSWSTCYRYCRDGVPNNIPEECYDRYPLFRFLVMRGHCPEESL